MRFRDDVLTLSHDMGTSGTVAFNLDYSDPISAIVLGFSATNGASGNKNNPVEANVTSIDIVDGSDVLWSLNGQVTYGYYAQEYGKQNNQYYSGALNDGQWVVLTIPFGRYLFDQEYAFNPRAHRNPQLKITFDEATIRAAGATGFVTDSFTCTVQCVLMEDVAAPRGFLMCKDISDFTTVASGDVQIDMPTDYPYRQLMLRVYERGTWFGSNVTNLKLSCDGGKFNTFDLGMDEYQRRSMAVYPPLTRSAYTVCDSGDSFATWQGIDLSSSIRSHISGSITGGASVVGGQQTIYHVTHAGVDIDGQPVHINWLGWFQHHVLQYNFGRLHVPEEWFDARQYNSVKLYLTQGNAGAAVNVCVQQVRSY